jgi:hypothetical protein
VNEQDALNTPITEIDRSPPKPSTRTGRQRQGRAVAGPSTKPKPDQRQNLKGNRKRKATDITGASKVDLGLRKLRNRAGK